MLEALGLEEAQLLRARKGDWHKRLIGQRVRQKTSGACAGSVMEWGSVPSIDNCWVDRVKTRSCRGRCESSIQARFITL